jgi:hypothetical protein
VRSIVSFLFYALTYDKRIKGRAAKLLAFLLLLLTLLKACSVVCCADYINARNVVRESLLVRRYYNRVVICLYSCLP